MTNEQLKPCPMCDGEARFNSIKYGPRSDQAKLNGQHIFHGVNCIVCGLCNRGLIGHKTPESAAEAWNRRAAPVGEAQPSVPAEVMAALDRMCQPLDESRLKGVTAAEDARCMALIRAHVLGVAPEQSGGGHE